MRSWPILIALAIVLAVTLAVLRLSAGDAAERTLGLSLALGGLLGFVLQRSRFCFFCHTRDLIEERDPRGVLAILLALAVGITGYLLVIGAWLPVPLPGRLPPDAHIGPVGPVLAIAALAFGFGMAISGSCISAHLYRLGEGSPTSLFAVLGAGLGFIAGFLSWNRLYLAVISESPVVWLPHHLGYAGTLGASLLALLLLAAAALWWGRDHWVEPPTSHRLDVAGLARRLLVDRWPAVFGGLAVGVISVMSYLRIGPLGVTAELGSIARSVGSAAGILPETLYGLDGFRGCMTVVKETLLSKNGLFVLGLVGASFASALVAGQFTPRRPSLRDALSGLAGGALMGWGAMTALGCTIGVLLSGIHVGAASGWIFLAACFLGTCLGLPLRRRIIRA